MASKKKQKKLNEQFFEAYINMDKVCCRRFGISNGGVTEYINKLIKTKLAPGRDEALTRLVKYRNVRNKIAHESHALESVNEIEKQDLKWIKSFKKQIECERDPYTLYIKRVKKMTEKSKKRRGVKAVFIMLLIAALAIAAYLIFK